MSSEQPTVLITGANRGIGLEFTRQWLERGANVIATARDVEGASALKELRARHQNQLRLIHLDVTDDASVQAMAMELTDVPINILINNAGVGTWGGLHDFNTQEALRVFNVNALGPLRVARAVLPNLKLAGEARIVSLTSGMGSIGDNQSGGSYMYRMSKAALNMATKSLSIDLRGQNICAVVINPGHVQTDMGGPRAPTAPEESVRAMIAIIDRLSLEDSGTFLNWKGNTYPW